MNTPTLCWPLLNPLGSELNSLFAAPIGAVGHWRLSIMIKTLTFEPYIFQALSQVRMDWYYWVAGWVANDRPVRTELQKVDLARYQVDLAKAFTYCSRSLQRSQR
jgi:hypothetical protein